MILIDKACNTIQYRLGANYQVASALCLAKHSTQGPLPNVSETQWINYDPCSEGAHNPKQKIDTCINNSNSRQTLICASIERQRKRQENSRVREEVTSHRVYMKVSWKKWELVRSIANSKHNFHNNQMKLNISKIWKLWAIHCVVEACRRSWYWY
jgi:hypothetical protein